MGNEVRNITELKRAAKARGSFFFDPSHSRIPGNRVRPKLYRAPYVSLNEGYIITDNVNWLSDDTADRYHLIYRFAVSDERVDFVYVSRHESFADAAAFLANMGAK